MQLAQPQLGVAATGHDMPERSDHPAVKGGAQDFLPPVNVGQAFGNSWKSQVTSGISATPGVQHPATGLVCFDDSISVVNQDVPCPSHTKKRSVELSHHHLESLLKGFGGGVLTEYMSVHPPAHITDLSVQDIEQLPKTPESRAEMADRLKGRLVLLQTRYSKLRDLIQSYVTSSAGLALRRTFLRFLNSVSNSSAGDSFCSQNNSETSEDVKVSKTNSKVSIVCQSLMSEAKRLSGLLARLEEVVETQTDFHHKLNSTYSNKTLCDQIKDLQQSIRLTASQIKELVKLHNSFQSSVVTLQNILPEAVILLEELVSNLRASTDSFERDTLKDSEISASKRKLVMTSSPAPHLNISPPFSHDETSQNQMTTTKTSSKDRSRSKPSHSSTTSSASTGKVSRRVTVQNSLKELSSIIIQIILNTDHKAVNAHQASLSHHIPESVSGDSSSAAEPNLQNAIEPTMPNVGKKDTLKRSNVHRSYDVIRRLLILMRRELEKMSGVLSAVDISEDATSDLGIDSYSALKHFERRVKKDVAGFALRSDACITQGQDIPGTNYVSLCSECEHTTILDSTYFPRFLTERICHPGTSSIPANQGGCLSENNSHGGECEQQHFHIPILRREPNKCMKVKSKGTEFITDKWHQSTYDLNIGCQCVLRKNSQFAKYARLP
ncbi:uncharacterized protein LOC101852924 [Aplysia californica]|uniref:Uncharacterized protein LOC101852924 n=1 Tax=Aplysia californica TaxID=6500 RepID=A0ABM0ZZ84_APLCA|nr:uncharacterized protein LOC101852924 [Aplysia californica]